MIPETRTSDNWWELNSNRQIDGSESERDRKRGGNHETMGEREEKREREGGGGVRESLCVTYKIL